MNEKTKQRTRRVLLGVGLLLAASIAIYFFVFAGRYVETDNAYVQADEVMLAPEVSGRITEVAVRENAAVEKDELLFRIDDEPYRIAVQQAEAALAQSTNELGAQRAALHEASSQLIAAREDVTYLERELKRKQGLAKQDVVTESRLDELRHQLEQARSAASGAERRIERIRASLGGDPELPLEKQAAYRQAQSALEKARLDLAHTAVRAPRAGIIANVDLQVGEMVAAGKPALALIATDDLWVEANLKETELTDLAVGQPADVHVDAYPNVTWKAHVASISPATGSEFSIIPPQNATGNWVKVIQRVPVRLALEHTEGNPDLRAGLSATVEIDTHPK